MTREEAKKFLSIIEAWAEGKTIEWQDLINDTWKDKEYTSFGELSQSPIKPEPKYRPFRTQEECWNEMLKHQPFGWLKSKKSEDTGLIGSIYTGKEVYIRWATNQENTYNVSNVFNDYVFTDGTPFGIKEE